MRILLVRPAPTDETIGLQHVMLVEPLELEVLAALARPDDDVRIVDLILERRPLRHFLQRHRPDVLGVTGYITNVPAMIAACRLAKRLDPSVVTVVGGVHCEVCPDHLDDPAVDYRVVRNATTAFGPLLEHIKRRGELPAGVLRPGERADGAGLPAFDFSFPRPRRDLTARYRSRYFYIFHDQVALLKTAFGCPFRCNFCFCRAVTAGHYAERPLDDVLAELAAIAEREIYIVDDDFLISADRVTDFLDRLSAARLDKSFLIYGRADFVAQRPALMERFKAQGLRTVIIGFESFYQDELTGFGKKVEVGANEEAMRVCRRLGIDVFATIVVSPSWGREQFAFHRRKFKELGIQYVNLQPLTPLPGTGLEVPQRDLLLAPGDFERWDLAHVALRPQRLGVAEFYQEIIKLYLATLYRPRYLLGYLKYPKPLLAKMIAGTFSVRRQYLQKLGEARRRFG
ncbi:MAG: cobalamin-dependent protein [Deltaproteobacteria bacterium]|nr:cobalamin-dependent protein [Deltaproteobacteria bacterium]